MHRLIILSNLEGCHGKSCLIMALNSERVSEVERRVRCESLDISNIQLHIFDKACGVE